MKKCCKKTYLLTIKEVLSFISSNDIHDIYTLRITLESLISILSVI